MMIRKSGIFNSKQDTHTTLSHLCTALVQGDIPPLAIPTTLVQVSRLFKSLLQQDQENLRTDIKIALTCKALVARDINLHESKKIYKIIRKVNHQDSINMQDVSVLAFSDSLYSQHLKKYFKFQMQRQGYAANVKNVLLKLRADLYAVRWHVGEWSLSKKHRVWISGVPRCVQRLANELKNINHDSTDNDVLRSYRHAINVIENVVYSNRIYHSQVRDFFNDSFNHLKQLPFCESNVSLAARLAR